MKVYRFCLLLTIVACATVQNSQTNLGERLPSNVSDQSSIAFVQNRMVELLRPFTTSLDRDLWTFRWETVEKDLFNPRSVEDLMNRINPWANRFFNPAIVSGADTGPGLYVAVDPTATAVFGGEVPRLFAIKIKKGTNVLIGDALSLPAQVLEQLNALATQFKCEDSTTHFSDLGHAVGYFRMSNSIDCRNAIIGALNTLSVQAISYGFDSSPLPQCRTTGTAISIINSNAIDSRQINAYSENGNIEGASEVTPFVKALYAESQNDFTAQSALFTLEIWGRYKRSFGFFDKIKDVSPLALSIFKKDHVLYCGSIWSIETDNPLLIEQNKIRTEARPEVKELLIRLILIYREKYRQSQNHLPKNTPSNFELTRMRGILKKYQMSSSDSVQMSFAVIPKLIADNLEEKTEFLKVLKTCFKKYENEKFEDVIKGECGMEPEKEQAPK